MAAELGVTPPQLKTWWLELEAAGSVAATAAQKANPTEKVIPGVEAGYRGPVPLAALRSALIFYSREGFEYHATIDANTLARAEELGDLHWKSDPYIETIRNARRRDA